MMDGNQKGTSSDELTPDVLERQGNNKVDDERKAGRESLTRTELANDAPEDENLKECTKEFAKPESGENPEIEEGENSGLDSYNALIGEPCEKVLQEESSLNPHMQKVSDVEDDDIKVTKILEFIPLTKPQDAKEGKTICFMHNEGD